ncbi:glycoside hydrolase family 11 protein [Clostridium cellulovorans]|uniref:glycoside hydrolase family 11 protein n=1 Tax=Clostridium cellulovorans TaxID=1493 RepID=UPI003BF90CC6
MLASSAVGVLAATKTITSNETGNFEGYDYEYWKDNGTGTMTLTGGGTFSCSWSNINNILFRTGKKLGSTKTYKDYGKISINYDCNYQPNGNSYMAVYGWTEDPLVEYYIIDSYGTWNPGSNSTLKGTTTVDGRTYQIYQNSRTGPSIKGNNTTFQQYWSICTSKRTSGTITVSDHFKAWENLGMKMGKMYEVSMVVEGYQSSGKADMTKMDLIMGDTPPVIVDQPTPEKLLGDVDNNGTVNALDLAIYKKFLLGMIPSLPATGDVDQNGRMNAIDFAMIKQHLLGIIKLGKLPTTSEDPNKKLVALTFDDGPSSQTGLVLDKLKKYNAKATFMVIGNKISSADAIMKRIVSEGHEIGNHGWSYDSMANMSASQITQEINQCNSAIKQYTGSDPKFFRPANLATSQTLFQTVKLPFVQGVIAQDWNGASATTAEARAQLVLNGTQDGSIVLMHCTQPGYHPTPEALDIIIPQLQQQGYSFVTLSDLFKLKGKTPQLGTMLNGAF